MNSNLQTPKKVNFEVKKSKAKRLKYQQQDSNIENNISSQDVDNFNFKF